MVDRKQLTETINKIIDFYERANIHYYKSLAKDVAESILNSSKKITSVYATGWPFYCTSKTPRAIIKQLQHYKKNPGRSIERTLEVILPDFDFYVFYKPDKCWQQILSKPYHSILPYVLRDIEREELDVRNIWHCSKKAKGKPLSEITNGYITRSDLTIIPEPCINFLSKEEWYNYTLESDILLTMHLLAGQQLHQISNFRRELFLTDFESLKARFKGYFAVLIEDPEVLAYFKRRYDSQHNTFK